MLSCVRPHEPVDEPGPMGRRFDHESRDLSAIGPQLIENDGQLIRSSLLIHHVVLRIESHENTVVCVQINSAI